jgi:hypothetical protein
MFYSACHNSVEYEHLPIQDKPLPVAFYTAGSYKDVACYWVNNTRHDLSTVSGDISSEATAIAVADDIVYMAGSYAVNNPNRENYIVTNVCYWVNEVRHDIETETRMSHLFVSDIAVTDGNVYIAGGYSYNNDVKKACYWVNGVRHDLETEAGTSYLVITDIIVSNSIVYVSGYYSMNKMYWYIDDTACYWVNEIRYDLEVANGRASYAKAITIAENVIYIAGYYTDNNDVKKACYWVNGVRHDLSAINGKNSGARAITVIDGTVYTAGSYIEEPRYDWTSKYAQTACYWVNGTRHDMRYGYDDSYATAIAVTADGTVYTAGFYLYYSLAPVCYWANGIKHNLSTGTGGSVRDNDIGEAEAIIIVEVEQ